MMALTESIRLVTLQFSFSNPYAVPQTARQKPRETIEVHRARRDRPNGELFIAATDDCSLAEGVAELEASGYELIDAVSQVRPFEEAHAKQRPSHKKMYWTVRYIFARRDQATISEVFAKVRETNRNELLGLCQNAHWRIRAYRNPFYENGIPAPGVSAISVNMEVRKPLYRPDGSLVTERKWDEQGCQIGDAPLPLAPKHRLRLNGAVQLEQA